MRITLAERSMAFALVLLLASVAQIAFAEENNEKLAYVDRPLTEVQLPPRIAGAEYESAEGLKLDDFRYISKLPAGVQPIAEKLENDFAPLGVVSVGDFSLTRPHVPIDGVTVRVFIFDTAEHCAQWFRKKYEYEGWEEHYKVVKSGHGAMRVLDSTQTNKRIYQFDRVWITSQQVTDGTEHQRAAAFIIEQLTTPDGPKKK